MVRGKPLWLMCLLSCPALLCSARTQILVNGVAIGGDFENLERYVCAAAPAASRPEACYQLPSSLQHMGRR
jgi:hypothetical protein